MADAFQQGKIQGDLAVGPSTAILNLKTGNGKAVRIPVQRARNGVVTELIRRFFRLLAFRILKVITNT